MAIKAYPLNLNTYVGAEYPMLFHYGRMSGVFGAANNLKVAANGLSMAVTVTDGVGWLSDAVGHGIAFANTTFEDAAALLELTIDMAHGSLPRIDRIIASWYLPNFSTLPEIKVLKGTAAATPAAPALTNNSEYRQISLAKIAVAAGVSVITAANVTDERLDAAVCGIVTSGVTIPTDAIQAQAQALIDQLEADIAAAEVGDYLLTSVYDDDGAVATAGGLSPALAAKMDKSVYDSAGTIASAGGLVTVFGTKMTTTTYDSTGAIATAGGIKAWNNAVAVSLVFESGVAGTTDLFQCYKKDRTLFIIGELTITATKTNGARLFAIPASAAPIGLFTTIGMRNLTPVKLTMSWDTNFILLYTDATNLTSGDKVHLNIVCPMAN